MYLSVNIPLYSLVRITRVCEDCRMGLCLIFRETKVAWPTAHIFYFCREKKKKITASIFFTRRSIIPNIRLCENSKTRKSQTIVLSKNGEERSPRKASKTAVSRPKFINVLRSLGKEGKGCCRSSKVPLFSEIGTSAVWWENMFWIGNLS